MKKANIFVSFIAVAAILTSCSTTMPLAVSDAPVGTKKGTSETIVLGAWEMNKNFGLAEAAKKGKIKGAIAFADLKTTNYFIFVKKEIIVNGN